MANNLKKFTTEAEYQQASLNYPAVSWVTSGDTVHFDKTAPIVPNDKVIVTWTTPSDHEYPEDIVVMNASSSPTTNEYFTTITLNDVDIISELNNGVLPEATIPNSAVTYTLKYSLTNEYSYLFSDAFNASIGSDDGSNIDVLIPAQITKIDCLTTNNVQNLVIESTTPPNISPSWLETWMFVNIWVPDNAVSAYQNDANWGLWDGTFNPISYYEGNLPV